MPIKNNKRRAARQLATERRKRKDEDKKRAARTEGGDPESRQEIPKQEAPTTTELGEDMPAAKGSEPAVNTPSGLAEPEVISRPGEGTQTRSYQQRHAEVMREFYAGKLRNPRSGEVVVSRQDADLIAENEARKVSDKDAGSFPGQSEDKAAA